MEPPSGVPSGDVAAGLPGRTMPSHAFAAHYREKERILAEERPFPLEALRRAMQGGTLEEVRALMAGHFRDAYGPEHHFVKALAEPATNYYRIDSAFAIQHAAADPARRLIVHLIPFQDDDSTVPAREWRDAREKFIAYYGCDVETFVHAVRLGWLVVTVQALDDYKGPFMRHVLEALHTLPEEARPVFARAAEASAAGQRSDWWHEVDELRQRLLRRGRLPALSEPGYRMKRGGLASRLPPVVPDQYLGERMAWFDFLLPRGGRQLVLHVWEELGRRRDEDTLELLMQTTSMFQQIFHAPILYSRGSSIRVCSQDLEALSQRLQDLRDFEKARLDAHRKAKRLAGWLGKGAGQFGDDLLKALATRVPVVAEGLGGAEDRMVRIIPKCLGSQRMKKVLDGVDRWVGAQQASEKELLRARDKIQADLGNMRADRVAEDAVVRNLESIRQLLPEVMALPKQLGLAKRETCLAAFKFGGALASVALPAAKPAFRVVEVAWSAANRYRDIQIPGEVRRELNPGLVVKFDYMQVEGEAWDLPAVLGTPEPPQALVSLGATAPPTPSPGRPLPQADGRSP